MFQKRLSLFKDMKIQEIKKKYVWKMFCCVGGMNFTCLGMTF